MTSRSLIVLGIDPGGETGWTWLRVLRAAIFGEEDPEILEWDYGVFNGSEPATSVAIARMARELQGLEYKTGPAIVSENWDHDPTFMSSDPEPYSPVRINAQLELLLFQNLMGDATLTFQSRTLAFRAYNDRKLEDLELYVENRNVRSSTKHALTALRRAREKKSFALSLWPYPATGMA